jgi:hypothetical protein
MNRLPAFAAMATSADRLVAFRATLEAIPHTRYCVASPRDGSCSRW